MYESVEPASYNNNNTNYYYYTCRD